MIKIILVLIVSGLLHTANAQTPPPKTKLSSFIKSDLGLQGIGFTYEHGMGKHFSTDGSLGVGGGYNIAEGFIEYQFLKPALHFSVNPKFYYNLEKRINKGKSAKYNSGNYFGARLKYNLPLYNRTDIIRTSILTNIHWGIQRAIGHHWTLNSLFGIGYASDIEYGFGTVFPAIDFKCSYIF
ncbi:MAG: hypothetical protein K2Q24_13640 [Chitinophagaceae bacterium]|jgi:hypothetical protein|nr:hypothetical protein [Chitinophagaceae bacterium]